MKLTELQEGRLERVSDEGLLSGNHTSIRNGCNVMEAISFIMGEPWSNAPECVCPVIAAVAIDLNDIGDDNVLSDLLDLLPDLIGTNAPEEAQRVEQQRRRKEMLVDWLRGEYLGIWAKCVGLSVGTGLEDIALRAEASLDKFREDAEREGGEAFVAGAEDDAPDTLSFGMILLTPEQRAQVGRVYGVVTDLAKCAALDAAINQFDIEETFAEIDVDIAMSMLQLLRRMAELRPSPTPEPAKALVSPHNAIIHNAVVEPQQPEEPSSSNVADDFATIAAHRRALKNENS